MTDTEYGAANIPPTTTEAGDIKEFFFFELDGELYAVPVIEVDQVLRVPPITSVPNAPQSIVGIFHLRGRVVVVLDLVRRMTLERKKPLAPSYLFVAHRGKNYFAILMDRARTVVRVPQNELLTPDPLITAHVPPQYVRGMFMYQEHKKPVRRREILLTASAPNPNVASQEVTPEAPPRPVLWLNLEKLLEQEDLMGVLASQEKTL